MKIIGLTGGIGMGKSHAARALRRMRLPVFDADAEVHRLQARNGRALPRIAAAFPGVVKDGELDRAALRHIVLRDQARLRVLEGILHPMVRAAQARFLARARAAGRRVAILDIPLLFETGGDRAVDLVMVVSAPRSIQIGRVRRRRGMSAEDAARMIALQMPDQEKRRRADVVIRTGLSRAHAMRQLRCFLARLQQTTCGRSEAQEPKSFCFFFKRQKKILVLF